MKITIQSRLSSLHRRNPILSDFLLTAKQFTSSTPIRINLCIIPHIGRATTRNQVFANKINTFGCDRHHSAIAICNQNSQYPDGKMNSFLVSNFKLRPTNEFEPLELSYELLYSGKREQELRRKERKEGWRCCLFLALTSFLILK